MHGWKVVEGKQVLAVLLQALCRLGILVTVGVEERVKGLLRLVAAFSHPDLVNALGLRLETLGELVQHVSRLVHPTALMACLAVDFGERLPQAQSAIADGELGTDLQPLVLEPRQDLQPALLRLPEAVLATNSLVPCSVTPTMTSRHSRACSPRTLKYTPSAHQYT
jgi:hypothetical protein